MVNGQRKQFVNEATEYNALGASFHVMDPTGYDYANLRHGCCSTRPVWNATGLASTKQGS